MASGVADGDDPDRPRVLAQAVGDAFAEPVTAHGRLAVSGASIRVAPDDFGTGYSSPSYLRQFPFNKIKIDRCFVRPIAEDREAAAIIKAIAGSPRR